MSHIYVTFCENMWLFWRSKSAHEAGSHCSSAGQLFCLASNLVSCFVPKPSGPYFRSSVHPGNLSNEVCTRVPFLGCASSWCRYSVPSTLPGWLGEDTRETGEWLFWIQPLTSNVPFSKVNERFLMISGTKWSYGLALFVYWKARYSSKFLVREKPYGTRKPLQNSARQDFFWTAAMLTGAGLTGPDRPRASVGFWRVCKVWQFSQLNQWIPNITPWPDFFCGPWGSRWPR